MPPEETHPVGDAFRTFVPDITQVPRSDDANVDVPAAPSGIVVKITDQNNRHPAGIPVRFSTKAGSRTVETDSQGTARISGPGRFRIDVLQGCHARVRVTGGGFANVSAPTEGEKPVELPVEWEQRFAPGAPAQANRANAWPIGANTKLRFAVTDRCAKQRTPGAPYPTFGFTTNDTVKVVGTPKLQADDEGWGWVTVTCIREGEPSVVAVDSKNPSDRFELARTAVGYERPHCRGS